MTDAQPRLLIKNGTLIDGSGCDPVPKTLVVVEGNRITHVRPADSPIRPESPDDMVIDATGMFILPGLIDAHCHISLHQGALPGVKYTSSAEFCTLWAAYAIGRVLRAGVTSIAVPGGKWFTDATVREAVEVGFWRAREWSSRVARSAITVVFSIPTPTLPRREPRPIRQVSCAIRVTSSSARPASNANAGST